MYVERSSRRLAGPTLKVPFRKCGHAVAIPMNEQLAVGALNQHKRVVAVAVPTHIAFSVAVAVVVVVSIRSGHVADDV